MTIQTQLFEGTTIRLAQYDHETDPAIASRWTQDISYLRGFRFGAVRPLSPAAAKKQIEQVDKDADGKGSLFHFAVRLRLDDRLLGFAEVHSIEWTSSNAFLRLGIGDPADRRQGYGGQALGLLLRYAFHELNLFRVTATLPEYNQAALALVRKHGFVEEVRRRQALRRDGRTADLLMFGLLREEWEQTQ